MYLDLEFQPWPPLDLSLVNCAFRPIVRLGRLRSLTTLNLCDVRITGDELECLLSSCVALQRLELRKCSEITWLKLPFLLQQLSCLKVAVSLPTEEVERESIFVDTSSFRRMPGYCLGKLKRVKICRFYSAKGLVELACHILENATSLECLTLDTSAGRCGLTTLLTCYPMDNLNEIPKAISGIRTYIEGIVPSRVELNVVKPCSRCYTG